MDENTIVQYILVRKDLKWPAGAVAAQCCHGEGFCPPQRKLNN